ncbi:protein kinase domain-containing protein [Bacillus xiapuensis]|uniref:protein kinase domain-containing protein n=1 Tax=Bacillus xiapuensis TaxID=2014075 RepID=UPI000C24165C|nr:serine/threonine-protein kinase [Bacillus xiapuensis]
MMMNTSKDPFNIGRGTVIRGKWHQNVYIVERKLGSGATGEVYLVKTKEGSAALKLSRQLSLTSEMNVLKAFDKVQGSSLGPSLLDADDWEQNGKVLSFYAMEFIQGPTLSAFIERRGTAWIGILLLQLLENLHALHHQGWIFGDIKPDNLIVSGPPFRIRCIDVGGTTKHGRAVKEYTEFFDRGYWGGGSRKADPAYDLFASAMVAVNLVYPRRFARDESGVNQLIVRIKQKQELLQYSHVLIKAVQGQYPTALAMRRELMEALTPNTSVEKRVKTNEKESRMRRTAHKKRRKHNSFLKSAVVILAITALYILYILAELLV